MEASGDSALLGGDAAGQKRAGDGALPALPPKASRWTPATGATDGLSTEVLAGGEPTLLPADPSALPAAEPQKPPPCDVDALLAQSAELLQSMGCPVVSSRSVAQSKAGARATPPSPVDDEAKWKEVFSLLQDAGAADRSKQYALTLAAIKRREDELRHQIQQLNVSEQNLLRATVGPNASSGMEALARLSSESSSDASKAWGEALATAVAQDARDFAMSTAVMELPDSVARLMEETQLLVAPAMAPQESLAATALASQHTALASQQAMVLQAQAQQAQLAQTANYLQFLQGALPPPMLSLVPGFAVFSAQEKAKGFNSRGLPRRPGAQPCTFFLARGQCSFGASCKFDHPEPPPPPPAPGPGP